MLTAIYHMLQNDTDYIDLGPNHFTKDRVRAATQILRKLDRLGFDISAVRDRRFDATA